ncbi:MAG: hypothetical protein H7138_02595 [Myxococcales bacterium]|nr:hypothetical protein [Myxococcales bacterium]
MGEGLECVKIARCATIGYRRCERSTGDDDLRQRRAGWFDFVDRRPAPMAPREGADTASSFDVAAMVAIHGHT